MDPVDLPEEVAESIFALLPVEDLLSCCQVSVRWRQVVNTNHIWRQFCRFEVDLENRPSVVQPSFVPPPCTTDLSPVCRSRLDYMREVHVKNNFRNNRFKEYNICLVDGFERCRMYHAQLINHYSIFCSVSGPEFKICDTGSVPLFVKSVPLLLPGTIVECFCTFGDYLVITQRNVLQVYSANDGLFSMKFCRIFDREEEFSYLIPSSDMFQPWYNNIHHGTSFLNIQYTDIVGNYFFGIVGTTLVEDILAMHIWDLNSGKKLATEIIPESTNSSVVFQVQVPHLIKCDEKYKCLYVALEFNMREDNLRTKVLCYNLNSLQFTQSYESKFEILFMAVHENVLALFLQESLEFTSCSFLCTTDGKEILDKKLRNYGISTVIPWESCNSKVAFILDKLCIKEVGYDCVVVIVDLKTYELMTIAVDFYVDGLIFYDHNTLLIKNSGVFSEFKTEVWDLNKVTRLNTLQTSPLLSCIPSSPMFFFDSWTNFNTGSVKVLDYW